MQMQLPPADWPSYFGFGQFSELQKRCLSAKDLDAISRESGTRLIPGLGT